MRHKLIRSLLRRLDAEIAPQNPLKYLRGVDIAQCVDKATTVLYLYSRVQRGSEKSTIYFAEVAAGIGHGIRDRCKLKRDSALAVRTGAFMLYTFEVYGIVGVVKGRGKKKHASYIVQLIDDVTLCEMWGNVSTDKVEKLPSLVPYEPWTSSKHKSGSRLVKTGNKEVLAKLKPETHPLIYACVNKAQEVGWEVRDDVFKLQKWALRNRAAAFDDIWQMQNPQAKATKLREARAISDVAERFKDDTFYHLYCFDFRGRKYPATAYFHEQGNDLARGLLKRHEAKAIGRAGYYWLLVSIASLWGGDAGREDNAKTDKIPMRDRYLWTVHNEEIILSYAVSPKVHQGWMQADKPWQFMAACFELAKLREWQYTNSGGVTGLEDDSYDPSGNFNYVSSLEVYIDGSNNGSQHLAALTRDEKTAPHVNLVPLELPGDLYRYVAEHVWDTMAETVSAMEPEIVEDCNDFIDTLLDFKTAVEKTAAKSERRKELVEKVGAYRKDHEYIASVSAPVYWIRITDRKHRRKICKRNVMTLPYGGTAYGLGQQQIDDARKHGVDILKHMEHKWGAYLGREIYNDCRLSLAKPMKLLSIFEAAGKKAEALDKFLSWTVPVTDFPVVQNYVEGNVKRVYTQYGPPEGDRTSTGYFSNTLQINVCFIEDVRPSPGRQSQGASPNAIHSLDAAHLTMTVAQAPFPVTTIHDSFGCLLADMPELFTLIRKTFVELYRADPLTLLMKDIDGDLNDIELGSLDVSLVLDSEYCFA